MTAALVKRLARNPWKTAAIIYCVVGFLTFGWCAANPCMAESKFWQERGRECVDKGETAFVAFYIGLGWPLYWDVKIFEHVRALPGGEP